MLNNIIDSLQATITAQTVKPMPSTAAELVQAELVQAEQTEVVDPQQLQETASKLTDYFNNLQRTLSFSVSDETGAIVIQVYDSETEELIREIPMEESIKLAAFMEQHNTSLFLDEQA